MAHSFPVLVTWTDPQTWVAVLVAGLLVAFIAMRARRAKAMTPAAGSASATDRPTLTPGQATTLRELVASEEVDRSSLLSRFVHNASGDRVGETVAIHKDVVVLKKDGAFYAVSQDLVLEKDGRLLADASIDWAAARTSGDEWRKGDEDVIEYDDQGMPVLNK